MNTVTELLQALIRTPSVHPDGDPGTDKVGEKACAELVGEYLRDSGAEVEFQKVETLKGDRPNVIGRWPSDRPGKPVLVFAPHTDTVSIAGMTIDPFSGDVHDGRVWGRGATDTKGSIAAMLAALRGMRDELPHLSHEIVFAGLCSEEAGQDGAKAFVAENAPKWKGRGAFAIAGEATGLNAVIAHKGAMWLKLTTRGRAFHASSPNNGENAIYKMADLMAVIRDRIAMDLAATVHPLLGHATISAGTIHGGSKINIVPDVCHAEVDVRYLPGDDSILQRISSDLSFASPGVEIQHAMSKPMLTESEHPVIQHLQALGAKCVGAAWFSDAAIFAHAGIPAIACGPGCMDQAHTKDEYIAVKDLEDGVAFFQALLKRLRTA